VCRICAGPVRVRARRDVDALGGLCHQRLCRPRLRCPRGERTRDRPIAAGRVSPREALLLFALLCLIAFLLVLTHELAHHRSSSLVGVLLAASYPFMKRYTQLPQVVLGAAFGWAIIMAFAAQAGRS
jgi:4-hydroxybenzoate polyprenyltransferase